MDYQGHFKQVSNQVRFGETSGKCYDLRDKEKYLREYKKRNII